MKQLTVKVDTQAFQAEMKRSGNGKVPVLGPANSASVPITAFVLIGERTAAMGGGMAGTGYVMQNGKATHSVSVAMSDVHNGFIRVP